MRRSASVQWQAAWASFVHLQDVVWHTKAMHLQPCGHDVDAPGVQFPTWVQYRTLTLDSPFPELLIFCFSWLTAAGYEKQLFNLSIEEPEGIDAAECGIVNLTSPDLAFLRHCQIEARLIAGQLLATRLKTLKLHLSKGFSWECFTAVGSLETVHIWNDTDDEHEYVDFQRCPQTRLANIKNMRVDARAIRENGVFTGFE